MRRLVCLLAALLLWAGGHALLLSSGSALQRDLESGTGAGSVLAAPLTVLGAVLIGLAALTSAWSSLGTILVGAVAGVAGLLAVAVPPGGIGSLTPIGAATVALGSGGELGAGLMTWLVSGAALAEGVVLLVLGIAAARRRRGIVAHPAVARLVSVLVTLAGLLPGVVLAVQGGARQEYAAYVTLRGADALGLVVLGLGVLVLALLALGTRWSGLGALVAGVLLFLATAAALVIPAVLTPVQRASGGYWDWRTTVDGLPHDLQTAIIGQVVLGTVTVIAALFALGGIASMLAGRSARQRHRSNFIEPSGGETEAEESPFGIPSFS